MENKGLVVKYDVRKVDTGKLVNNCFVLRPDKDPAAIDALIEYALRTENVELQQDIAVWLKQIAGKEDVNYYEVGEGEYVAARSEEEARDFYHHNIANVDEDDEVWLVDDLYSFVDGTVLKHILKAERIPAYTHSDHAY
ncbi:hypothetical protein [uncultured Brevibacillus sp.]|uniref:hypothetical protein n=1 Tax=uncultured Brevibacillus sp. TaxID=169970 RepID=UPI002594FC65|nr:hypothetical protein [uncultured Brevibacillus sp.]